MRDVFGHVDEDGESFEIKRAVDPNQFLVLVAEGVDSDLVVVWVPRSIAEELRDYLTGVLDA